MNNSVPFVVRTVQPAETCPPGSIPIDLYGDDFTGSARSGITSITAGSNVTVDGSDPENPIIHSAGTSAYQEWIDLGNSGTPGDAGPRGLQGLPGDRGPEGPQGPPGEPGSIASRRVISASVSVNQEVFYDVDTLKLGIFRNATHTRINVYARSGSKVIDYGCFAGIIGATTTNTIYALGGQRGAAITESTSVTITGRAGFGSFIIEDRSTGEVWTGQILGNYTGSQPYPITLIIDRVS